MEPAEGLEVSVGGGVVAGVADVPAKGEESGGGGGVEASGRGGITSSTTGVVVTSEG